MKEVQFSAVVLLFVLAALLASQMPGKVRDDKVTNRSRWLMAGGLALLAIQFLLQYIFGFRQTSVVKAVMLNLAMFMPCAWLLSLGILNLQRQGRILRKEALAGVGFYLVAMCILAWGWHTQQLLLPDVLASVIYCILQVFYTRLVVKELKRMKEVLADYYDRDPYNLVGWMQVSIAALSALALTVPFCIFLTGWPIALYSLLALVTITYLWWNFVRYVMGSAALRMKEADDDETPVATEPSFQLSAYNALLIKQWIDAGGYRQHNLKSADVAQELKIPRSHLLSWVKSEGYESFTRWITTLRIEEAKRLLHEQPDYDIGHVADLCGISRSHFHTLFKKEVGQSPTAFQQQ